MCNKRSGNKDKTKFTEMDTVQALNVEMCRSVMYGQFHISKLHRFIASKYCFC